MPMTAAAAPVRGMSAAGPRRPTCWRALRRLRRRLGRWRRCRAWRAAAMPMTAAGAALPMTAAGAARPMTATGAPVRGMSTAGPRGPSCRRALRRLGRRRRCLAWRAATVPVTAAGAAIRGMSAAGPQDPTCQRALRQSGRRRRSPAWRAAAMPETAAAAPIRGMSAPDPRGPTCWRAPRRLGRPRRRRARQHGRSAPAPALRGRVAQPEPAARWRRACVVRAHQAHRTVGRAFSLLVEQQRLHAPVSHAANLRCRRGVEQGI